MGKAASKFTQALGFGKGNASSTLTANDPPIGPKAPQWDTTIDQLFGDAPPDDNGFEPPAILEPPVPRRRQRRPPPPPPLSRGGRRRPLPSASAAGATRRRQQQRSIVKPMRTPIVSDMPRRRRQGAAHAVNAPFGVNRRPMVLPAPVADRDIPSRVALNSSFKRRGSSRRGR